MRVRRGGSGRRLGRGRAPFGAACCALALLLCGAGCLNPRPEDDPSVDALDAPGAELEPVRESCDQNPALAGCGVPDRGAGGDEAPRDLDAEDGAAAPNAGATPSPVDAGSVAASLGSDAGAPLEATDAAAPPEAADAGAPPAASP